MLAAPPDLRPPRGLPARLLGCFVCSAGVPGAFGPGRLISGRRGACPPACRPRRELRSARRLEARPGPAGPAASSNRAVLGVLRWCSGRLRARPPARSPHASCARSGRSRSPPVPSGPSGALHTGGVAASSNRAVLGVLRWCFGHLRARPPDLRPPRGLPARSPSAPRASLGASSRSPARPCRPRGGLPSGGTWCACTWPGPAAAHGHRSPVFRRPSHQWDQALQAPRRPPIGRSLVPPGGPPRRCLSLGAPRAPGA